MDKDFPDLFKINDILIDIINELRKKYTYSDNIDHFDLIYDFLKTILNLIRKS